MGAVIDAAAYKTITGYINHAKRSKENRILAGGGYSSRKGYFIEPTVVQARSPESKLMKEEIFGPVLTILKFDSDDEAIRLANDNIYGLAASIWTRDISRALRYSDRLDAGTVWINNHDIVDSSMPCGGFRQSGFGKDMGPEQLQHFTRTKAVWVTL